MNVKTAVVEMQRGSQPAFQSLVLLFTPRLHNNCLRAGIPRHWSEDVVQEIWIHVWQNRQVFCCDPSLSIAQIENNFISWLFQISMWKQGDAFRQIYRHKSRTIHHMDTNGTIIHANGNTVNTPQVANNKSPYLEPWEQHYLIERLAGYLSEHDQELLTLRYLEQRSWSEVEKALRERGRPVNKSTLRKRHERILKKLRGKFEPEEIQAFS